MYENAGSLPRHRSEMVTAEWAENARCHDSVKVLRNRIDQPSKNTDGLATPFWRCVISRNATI